MNVVESMLAQRLNNLPVATALVLRGARRLGAADARVVIRPRGLASLVHLAAGQIGRVAADHVEGRLDLQGNARDLMAVAAWLLDGDPRKQGDAQATFWWRAVLQRSRSSARHTLRSDARAVRQHYDVSDDFYALWLDPQRVYSCAYYREPTLDLAAAQQAKLDHICRKLMLREGDRFLDIGCGWGALLLWAAQHYGVHATGITLSRNQHAHVMKLIEQRGLAGRVDVQLVDYRELQATEPFDKIASVGMFEHVGQRRLPQYFAKLYGLLRPGGLLLNHGITANNAQSAELSAGMGEFIERYIFPGGELLHLSHVLRVAAQAQLETLDVENLRPHYARTLWAWSDALEAHLPQATALSDERVVRAWRLYLAGSAMSFERGWISLHQVLAARPSGQLSGTALPGAQCDYPFQRDYMAAAARQQP